MTLRQFIASRFGHVEHTMGILLGICLWLEVYFIGGIEFIVPACIWSMYFISHRLEKKIYGRHGFR